MLACLPVLNAFIIRDNFSFFFSQGGAVAQLGARVNGIHEVAGSIPASSTKQHVVCPVGYFKILLIEPADKTRKRLGL